jgi:ribosomal protein L40E
MTSCTNCGADNSAGVKFCKQCGTPISAPAVVPPCVSCGADLPAGAKFCKKCGTPVAAIGTAATAPSMPSPGNAIEKLTTVTEQVIAPVVPAAELPPELEKLPEPAPAPLPENPVVQAGLAFEPAAAPESVPAQTLAPEPAPAPAPVSTPSPVAGQPPLIEEKSFEKSTPPLSDNAPYGLPATPEKSDQKQLKMIVAGVAYCRRPVLVA